jgi:tRNA A37 threonylcarbamoyltransferase TsaD
VERWKEEEGRKPLSSKKYFNTENGYSVSDLNKRRINFTKEPSDNHMKTLKEEILEQISEKFMEKILDMVNQNIKDALKKFQGTKSNIRRHRNK